MTFYNVICLFRIGTLGFCLFGAGQGHVDDDGVIEHGVIERSTIVTDRKYPMFFRFG